MASRVASARERLARGSPALDAAASTLLDRAVDRIPLSGRGRARVVRVSQTVACLAGEGQASPSTSQRPFRIESRARARRRCMTAGWPAVVRGAPDFQRLGAIYDPPARLYLRGTRVDLLHAAVAVVGARSCSAYGRQVARWLGRELAAAGLVVVSGLARGVDGEAHRGALDVGGATVAVLGCGIDRDYPCAHAELAQSIARNGLISSEYPPGRPWRSGEKPYRRGPLAGGGGCRSQGAIRGADHRRLRARGGPGGVRRAGRGHERPLCRIERAAPPWSDASALARRRPLVARSPQPSTDAAPASRAPRPSCSLPYATGRRRSTTSSRGRGSTRAGSPRRCRRSSSKGWSTRATVSIGRRREDAAAVRWPWACR